MNRQDSGQYNANCDPPINQNAVLSSQPTDPNYAYPVPTGEQYLGVQSNLPANPSNMQQSYPVSNFYPSATMPSYGVNQYYSHSDNYPAKSELLLTTGTQSPADITSWFGSVLNKSGKLIDDTRKNIGHLVGQISAPDSPSVQQSASEGGFFDNHPVFRDTWNQVNQKLLKWVTDENGQEMRIFDKVKDGFHWIFGGESTPSSAVAQNSYYTNASNPYTYTKQSLNLNVLSYVPLIKPINFRFGPFAMFMEELLKRPNLLLVDPFQNIQHVQVCDQYNRIYALPRDQDASLAAYPIFRYEEMSEILLIYPNCQIIYNTFVPECLTQLDFWERVHFFYWLFYNSGQLEYWASNMSSTNSAQQMSASSFPPSQQYQSFPYSVQNTSNENNLSHPSTDVHAQSGPIPNAYQQPNLGSHQTNQPSYSENQVSR